jgi:hypothetical protein
MMNVSHQDLSWVTHTLGLSGETVVPDYRPSDASDEVESCLAVTCADLTGVLRLFGGLGRVLPPETTLALATGARLDQVERLDAAITVYFPGVRFVGDNDAPREASEVSSA